MMNPKDTYLSVLNGEKPDRLPLYVANMSDFLQFYYGISAREFVDNPDTHVEFTMQCAEEFKFGCVAPVAYILFGCGPEMGVNWRFVGDNLPGFVEAVIKEKKDLEKVKIPSRPSGYFNNYLQILKKLKKKIGKKAYLLSFVLGPFANACFLRGLEETLLDPLIDLPFYQSYMPKCVELSKFLGEHILDIELPVNILNEIFLSPDIINPDYFHQYIAPYDNAVCKHFQKRNQNLPNSYAAFMGDPGDLESQKAGRILFDHYFGTKESLDVIRKGIQYAIPGYPAIITLSGRMMATWPKSDIIDFLEEGLNLLVREKKKYPAIRLTSLQPPNKEEAFKMAEKIRTINDFIDSYKL